MTTTESNESARFKQSLDNCASRRKQLMEIAYRAAVTDVTRRPLHWSQSPLLELRAKKKHKLDLIRRGNPKEIERSLSQPIK